MSSQSLVPASTLPVSARGVAIVCGLATIISSATLFLEQQGFYVDPAAPLLVVLDIPRGYAFHALEAADLAARQVIVVTWSFCPEYCEDLWDIGLDALLLGDGITLQIVDAITRVARGERYRLTPHMNTQLTPVERRILRLLARGYSNERIAHHVSMQVQTVKNMLATIYRKLNLKNRSEALLYYWGIWYTLAQDGPPLERHAGY